VRILGCGAVKAVRGPPNNPRREALVVGGAGGGGGSKSAVCRYMSRH